MSEHNLLNDVATGVGVIFGFSGFVLGLLSFYRDRASVCVELQWDMEVTGNPQYDESKKWGLVRISNVGRRPIYISHAALKVPKGHDHTHLVLMDGINGKKLGEGDPSEVYVVDQDGLEAYKDSWRKVRAQVQDTTGKAWRSKKLKRGQSPSWAK